MIRVNVHDAKTNFSRYLSLVAEGEVVIVCRRNVPIARLEALPAPLDSPRPIGLAKGSFTVTDAFFEPLPDEWLDAFEGSAG